MHKKEDHNVGPEKYTRLEIKLQNYLWEAREKPEELPPPF